MSIKNRMTRGFFVTSVCLFAQAIPAFAEKTTLECSLGPEYVKTYYTFDTDAKTVRDVNGTFPIQVTDDAVTWLQPKIGDQSGLSVRHIYNRQTAQLSSPCGYGYRETCVISCVRAPPRPL